MTNFDDEYLAPVINLFGDRSTAEQADTTGEGSSSEEPSAESLRALPTMADFSPHCDNELSRRGLAEPEKPSESSVPSATPVGGEHTAGRSKAERRQARDGFSEISRVSMRALARRGMSTHEMTQFLGTREFESAEIDDEIVRLEDSGLLDDAALAETLTRTLRERKGLGSSAIKAELRRRKIDQEHISALLDGERDEEQERATEIALKRAPQLRSLDSVTAKRRLTGFLMRKGYSGSIVSAAVSTALAPGTSESSGGPVFR